MEEKVLISLMAEDFTKLFTKEMGRSFEDEIKEMQSEAPPESVEDANTLISIKTSLLYHAAQLSELRNEMYGFLPQSVPDEAKRSVPDGAKRFFSQSVNPDEEALKEFQGRLWSIIGGGVNTMVSKFQSPVASFSRRARKALNTIWRWFTGVLTSILVSIAKTLKVQSWSLGVTGGFPVGISTTITITFAP